MLIRLLGVYILVLSLMTLTLLQGHMSVRNINCNSVFWILFLSSLNVEWLLRVLKDNTQYVVCNSGVYSREMINMLFVCQVSGLVKNFNIGIIVINVKLCMMVLHIELYLFIPLSVTLTNFQDHRNVEQF